MAQRVLPDGAANRPRGRRFASGLSFRRVFAQSFGVPLLALFGLAASITPLQVPLLDAPQPTMVPPVVASISYAGADPVITGSVNQLFQSSSFVGPARSQKTYRLRARVDVNEFVATFAPERTRLAALRAGAAESVPVPQTPTVQSTGPLDAQEAARISLAAVDPALASAALEAIEEATPRDPSIPLPSVFSERLAYSRANTPATERAVSQYSDRERWCMATGIYFEARGESYRGQVAVAQVIMNRVKHRLYPDTICGVVFQNQSWRNRCQFSFACDGIPERVNDQVAWAKATEITEKVTSGELYLSEVNNATHYHANYVYPAWAPRMTRITRIGAHIFYRFKRG